MGKPNTTPRPRGHTRGQRYLARKAARIDGKPMASRDRESPPWYTFTIRPPRHLAGLAPRALCEALTENRPPPPKPGLYSPRGMVPLEPARAGSHPRRFTNRPRYEGPGIDLLLAMALARSFPNLLG